MFYVTDTHSFIFYMSKEADNRLPQGASKIFKESEENEHIIHIPTIVLAEVQYLVENEKIRLDIDQMMAKIKLASNFRVSGFDTEILKIFQKSSIPEIHDRIIVSTAKYLDAPLITRDKKIKENP